MPNKNIVFIIGGGGMSGIFASGVLQAFEDADIYPRIHAVYGSSSGADVAAFFLANQSATSARFFCKY